MNVAVFIARDEEGEKRPEFPRYGKWFSQHNVNAKGGGDNDKGSECSYWWDGGDDEVSASAGPELSEHFINPLRFVRECQDGALVICSKKFESFSALKQSLSQDDAFRFMAQLIGLVLHEVIKTFLKRQTGKENAQDKVCKIDRLCLFIHWGGGDSFTYEKSFAKHVEEFRKSPLLLAALDGAIRTDRLEITIDKIWAFAVSSRRESCFNVNGDMISPPETSDGIEQLVSRFTFDLVKDTLTKYVVENETLTTRTTREKFSLDSADVVAVLRRYLEYMRDDGIVKAFSMRDVKWLRPVIETVLQSFHDDGSFKIEYRDDISALFTLLIQEGVRHG